MSIQALNHVLGNRKQSIPPHPSKGSERLCMISLANHADADWTSWPGVEVIAEEANVSVRRTQDALTRCVDAGWLSRIINGAPDERIPKDRRPNRYEILRPGDDGVYERRTPSDGQDPPDGVRETGATGCANDAERGARIAHPNHQGALMEPPERTTPATAGDDRTSIVLRGERVPVDWTVPQVAVDGGRLGEALELSLSLARMLAARGEAGDPEARGRSKRWVLPMENMLRIDGRDHDQVSRVLHWLDNGSDSVAAFWRPNVRSPEKLRAQWARIAEQYEDRVKRGSGRSMPLTDGAVDALVHDPRRSRPAGGSALPLAAGGET